MSTVDRTTRRLGPLVRAGTAGAWLAEGLDPAVPGKVSAGPQPGAAHLGGPASRADDAMAQGPRPAHRPAGGAPTLTLDLQALTASGFLAPGRQRSALGREFSQIKRPLLANLRAPRSPGSRETLIMVTSALAGEGRTYCAINLAMSIAAEIDLSVLLVDADVVRPDLLRALGVAPQHGLLDLLVSPGMDPAEVICKTNIPNLSLLPAGTPQPLANELLASDAMDRLLAALAEDPVSPRIVIIDSPALLLASEAALLASRVGQIVMVVRAGVTGCEPVAQALALLEACPIVMPLLNQAPRPALPLGNGTGGRPKTPESRGLHKVV